MYASENFNEKLKTPGEYESCITKIRCLGKFNLLNHKPRSLLVVYNEPWVVRKKLSPTC